MPDVIASTALVSFTNQEIVNVFGGIVPLTNAQIVWSVWDASTPRVTVDPGSFTIHLTTFQVIVTFAVAQSGILVLDSPPTRYGSTFTSATSISVPGVAHALGTPDLFWTLYDDSNPSAVFQPASLTVHPTTYDVTVTVGSFPRSGRIVLTPGRTGYATNFTNISQASPLVVAGTTHGLGPAPLLYQVYDAQTPRRAIPPGSLTMHPSTGDVTLSFNVPQSGRLLLASVIPPTVVTQTLPRPAEQRGKIGPVDPIPQLLTLIRTMHERLSVLEDQQLALLSHLTSPSPPEETS